MENQSQQTQNQDIIKIITKINEVNKRKFEAEQELASLRIELTNLRLDMLNSGNLPQGRDLHNIIDVVGW